MKICFNISEQLTKEQQEFIKEKIMVCYDECVKWYAELEKIKENNGGLK